MKVFCSLFGYIFLILAFFVPSLAPAKPKALELEHTIAEIEGSSWRTDDAFRDALELDESQIPWLFRLPLLRPKPLSVPVPPPELHYHVFIDDTVLLYREINLCYDQRLKIEGAGFAQALDFFLNKMAGVEQPGMRRPLKLQLLKVDARVQNPGAFSLCDILAIQVEEGQFPFSKFQTRPHGPSRDNFSVPQLVLGLYYHQSESSLPVIAFHPSLDIDFQGRSGQYIESLESPGLTDRIKVDGRSLLFHELGHALGFAHIHVPSSLNLNPEISVMGIENSQRNIEHIEMRFSAPAKLWRRWDPQQASIYRSLLWKWVKNKPFPKPENPYLGKSITPYLCVMPGEVLDLNFRTFGTDAQSTIYDFVTKLPSLIALQNPQVTMERDNPLRRAERFAVYKDLDLLLTTVRPSVESAGLFVADHLENSSYLLKASALGPYASNEIEAQKLQISTIVGSFTKEAQGNYLLNGSFRAQTRYPASYMPLTRLEVLSDPSECYKDEKK